MLIAIYIFRPIAIKIVKLGLQLAFNPYYFSTLLYVGIACHIFGSAFRAKSKGYDVVTKRQ